MTTYMISLLGHIVRFSLNAATQWRGAMEGKGLVLILKGDQCPNLSLPATLYTTIHFQKIVHDSTLLFRSFSHPHW